MRRIGLIGGIGPESTVVYYRTIVDRLRALLPDGRYPEFAVENIDMATMLDHVAVASEDPAPLVAFLAERVGRLERAGAEVVALCSNTPHVAFDELRSVVDVDLVSIVDATIETLRSAGHRRAALFGTRFTMEGGFYRRGAAAAGVDVVVPNEVERTEIHDRYMGELVVGEVRPETTELLRSVAERMRSDDGIDALILGGTELPLAIGADDLPSLPVVDSTMAHIDALIDAASA